MKRYGYTITEEDALRAQKLLKKEKRTTIYRRLQVIALKGEGYTNVEIAKITDFTKEHVSYLIRQFLNHGFDRLTNEKRGGANNRKVTEADEIRFLSEWEQLAENGQIIDGAQMQEAFNKEFSTDITLSAFYKLLHRHGWRKVMPRTMHPKVADAETIEASKKLKLS